ncbi:MAG: hypothetical protein ACLUNQ_08860 [Oscillospiraceae bacterium]
MPSGWRSCAAGRPQEVAQAAQAQAELSALTAGSDEIAQRTRELE